MESARTSVRDRSTGCPPGADHEDRGALGESALPGAGAFGERALPTRKPLSHDVPPWVPEHATFFITVNCLPRGKNQLAIDTMASRLSESVFLRAERGAWWPHLVLLMPDHLHALLAFRHDRPPQRIISDWKRYTARRLGIRWQRDFFDHRIRNKDSLAEKWEYVLQNPVRAGLVPSPQDWPFVWVGRDGSPSRPGSVNPENRGATANAPYQRQPHEP